MISGHSETRPTTTLTVDTYLTHQTHPVKASKASLAADIAIFNEAGEREIQVEDLTVRALANTAQGDDAELYLHTVMDIDPTDQIVGPGAVDIDGEGALLAENCRQIVASYFDNASEMKTTKGSTAQSHSDMTNNSSTAREVPMRRKGESTDTIISNSDHPDFLRGVEKYMRTLKRGSFVGRPPYPEILSDLDKRAVQFSIFSAHLGRIMKQITHRYPWMNILHLNMGQSGLTRSVLNNIGDTFESFNFNGTQNEITGRGQWQNIGFGKWRPDQFGSGNMIDVMIAPSTLFGDGGSISILEEIREVMRPGGFLVLVETYPFPRTAGRGNSTLPQFHDMLEDHGFVREAHGSDQLHPVGSILVRRLFDTRVSSKPKIATNTIENLFLIGGAGSPEHDQLVVGLQGQLSSYCHAMTHLLLTEASTQDLESCDVVLMLADLDKPLMSNLTQHTIDQLRVLLRSKVTVLWVIRGALGGNPEHAASLGFTRTIVAEVPTLKLQVLDLDPDDKCPANTIASTLLQLISSDGQADGNPTSILEREIHMKDGRRLIPRLVPWKHGNNRFNASRRVVTRPVNTFKQRIELLSQPILDDSGSPSESGRFQLKEIGPGFCPSPRKDDTITSIQVDYSSLQSFELTKDLSGYVCVGWERGTQNRMLAFSPTNSSYIDCPALEVTKVDSKDDVLPSPTIIHRLIRSIAALASVRTAPQNHRIILINPDFEFAKSLADMLALERKLTILGTSCCEAGKLFLVDSPVP